MLMAFISEVRKLRTSLRAKPNQKINIYIDDNEKLKYLGELDNIKTIKKLVNADKIIFTKPNQQKNTIISGLFNEELFFVELDSTISEKEALSRLNKTKIELENQLAQSLKKTRNEEFLKKAPPSVVKKEKNKLKELNEALKKTQGQLEKILNRN